MVSPLRRSAAIDSRRGDPAIPPFTLRGKSAGRPKIAPRPAAGGGSRGIPPFTPLGELPPGIHRTSWRNFVARFGTNPHRRAQMAAMLRIFEALKRAGCQYVYVGGSMVTLKAMPEDFDFVWGIEGVDKRKLPPILFASPDEMKAFIGGEGFSSAAVSNAGQGPDFLMIDDRHGAPRAKGIVRIDLDSLP